MMSVGLETACTKKQMCMEYVLQGVALAAHVHQVDRGLLHHRSRLVHMHPYHFTYVSHSNLRCWLFLLAFITVDPSPLLWKESNT
jgi:hypothetical protein